MKSQDVFLLLKLVSLEKQEKDYSGGITRAWPSDWGDWEEEADLSGVGLTSGNEIFPAPDWLTGDGVSTAPAWFPDLQKGYEASTFSGRFLDLRQRENKGVDLLNGDDLSPVLSFSVDHIKTCYTARSLEDVTGISKSQVNLSLKRCQDVGLLRYDRKTGLPRVNAKALTEFIVFGLKYVFPARPAEIVRGVATAFAAPVLKQKLMSAGELIPVWPDARGRTKGQSIEPLFKSVPFAVRKDPELYALLALVDAIRIGQPREVNLAVSLLKQHMEVRE